MSLLSLVEESRQDSNLLTLEATVATGFEYIAVDECTEKLGKSASPLVSRGRIFFNVPAPKIDVVEKLRSIDNIYVVIKHVPNLQYTGNNLDADIAILKKTIEFEDVAKAVKTWCKRNKFRGIAFPSKEVYISAKGLEDDIKSQAKVLAESRMKDTQSKLSGISDQTECQDVISSSQSFSKEERTRFNMEECKAYHELDKRKPEDKVLKYRVTCIRNGKHCFGSQDGACGVGGILQDMFHWVVDLNLYDMEIMLNIRDDSMYYGIALTKVSLHHRNITSFGPTTLRSTICYNMLRLAQPKVGDVVIDPLCGGGSIPIEGALAYPGCFYISGDLHQKAVARTAANVENPSLGRLPLDVFFWDTTHLPLRDSSVDIFITDLPFGKRSGSVFDNRLLYKKILLELGRVISLQTGRAILLTCDKKSICKAIAYTAGLWSLSKKLKINIGGLEAGIFVLSRLNTIATVPPPPPKGKRAKLIKKKMNKSASQGEKPSGNQNTESKGDVKP